MRDKPLLTNRVLTTGKPIFPAAPNRKKGTSGEGGFNHILREAVDKSKKVTFSKHAEARLSARNIKITAAQMQKIDDAVAKADEKGVRESLVLMDNLALVVSVRNKTVITAIHNEEMKENVFTNIDGAVIV
ncbi:MAG: flagellar biosynthesis protein [Firmicutes bacterium]|nr:flagellar biosynthesis protein [Bacillota bacterium]